MKTGEFAKRMTIVVAGSLLMTVATAYAQEIPLDTLIVIEGVAVIDGEAAPVEGAAVITEAPIKLFGVQISQKKRYEVIADFGTEEKSIPIPFTDKSFKYTKEHTTSVYTSEIPSEDELREVVFPGGNGRIDY